MTHGEEPASARVRSSAPSPREAGSAPSGSQSVCSIVKAYAERIGLKPADFGAHSLRAGFLTSAARRGASVFKMRDVSRHKSMDVLPAYVRDADLFRDHARGGPALGVPVNRSDRPQLIPSAADIRRN
jgi:hypothetical protein